MSPIFAITPRRIFLLATMLLVGTLGLMLLRGKSRQQLVLPFNPPDCVLPCILGIVPGETDITSALQDLTATGAIPGSHTHGTSFEVKAMNGSTFYAVLRGTDPRLGRYVSQLIVYSLWPDKVTTLGEILDAGFTPVRVFRNRTNSPSIVNLLLVFGEDERIVAQVTGFGSISAESPVFSLTVLAKEDRDWRLGDILMIQHWDYEIEWKGFAPMEAYLNQAPPDFQTSKPEALRT